MRAYGRVHGCRGSALTGDRPESAFGGSRRSGGRADRSVLPERPLNTPAGLFGGTIRAAMTLNTIFTVRNEHLTRLSADGAVLFLADLLRAETRRIGLPVTAVKISNRTHVPDGGVDASIDAAVPQDSGLAKAGTTVFQVKAGDFKPWQRAVVRDELFGRHPASRDFLGAPVRACMDAGGRYVLVCTGIDLTVDQRTKAIDQILAAFAECEYPDSHVDVLSQNQIIALLQALPSLSLDINGNGSGPFETYRRWADDDQMRVAFKPGEPQAALISGLADALRLHDAAIHVHVRGEAGIGKTRLALEALRQDDLAPLVIYCDGPSKIRDSVLLDALLREDNPFSLILVVDECDADTRSMLWDKLKHAGPRVKLVSIYSDFDDTTGNITCVTAPPLDDDKIIEILQEYLPAAESARRWAEFCSGSPRVAQVVGRNLKYNPHDLLKSPDTVRIWDRYVVGADKANSPEVQQRKIVLRRLALFKRFGFGSAVIAEAKAIAALCAQDDPSITWARFEEIIHDLKARKILQGETTLYITPKLLHIKLYVDWWDIHGGSFVLDDIEKAVPPRLLDWFFEMSKYAEESQTAQRVFKTLLDENGPFQQSGLLKDPRGARFLLSLSEAAPATALQALQKTVGTWNKDELLAFTEGRRQVVWALERIAVWRALFPEAARLLLGLAEAENETWSNNATGVFADLFAPGQSPVAPTEAPPEERFPVLREALLHESKECRRIALLACGRALQTGHFVRMAGAEHQGLKRQPQLWTPKTWGEVFDAYRRVWHLLRERLELMPQDEREQALEVMLSHARGLTHMANLAPMVTDTLAELLTKPWVDQRKVIRVVETVLHYDAEGYEPSVRDAWTHLQKSLVTDGFPSLMRRYAGMDLLEDRFDEDGQHTNKAQPKIEALAQQALASPGLLKPELAWLTTEEAKNGYSFGLSLGMRDKGFSLLPMLLDAQRNATANRNVSFLGGYLRALHEQDQDSWELVMDSLAADPMLRTSLPELTWRSGLTDRAAARILELAKAGGATVSDLRLFSYGGVIQQLSPERFAEWIGFLLGAGSQAAAACAVGLCHFYYLMGERKPEIPKGLVFDVLTAPALFAPSEDRSNATREDYEWTEVATAYADQYAERAVDLVNLMLEHFREDGTIVGAYHSQTNKVLDEVLRRHPIELWQRIAAYLGPPVDSRAFHIHRWLRDGALASVPADPVWRWVEQDVETRARYVAEFVPSAFPGDDKAVSAREVLVRYGSREGVRSSLMANFSTETWWGPESSHAQQKLDRIRSWREGETNANVLQWLNEYMASLERRVERAKVEEEREF
jgi:hypothetical protein